MSPLAGRLHSLLARHAKVWKAALKEASKSIEAKVYGQTQTQLEPVLVRNVARQPLHPAARIRQTQSRWYSTKRTFTSTVRQFANDTLNNTSHTARPSRASFPKSAVGNAVIRSAGRAPFASTLRPNLTGGTLGRTAGGYGLGGGRVGGARYFSHGPASQAQVVQNVSQAVRAFFVSGQKAQYNGSNPVTGEKRYKAVTALQEETGRKMRDLPKATPGSFVDFSVNPTITALTPLGKVAGYSSSEPEHLNSEGLMDVLSVDFSRALKDLAAVLNDLKRLSALGDLPITYQASSLRIHFPGCDTDTVERLCAELNVQRGIVVQDEDFDAYVGAEIALLFPFAPTSEASSEASGLFDAAPAVKAIGEDIDWRNMLSPSERSEHYSTRSATGFEDEEDENLWLSSPSGYESVNYSSEGKSQTRNSPLEYQGFEGIYRFIEQCDSVRR